MSSASDTNYIPSNFEALFDAALAKYAKQTGTDLRNHPLANMIDSCDSPDSILAIFEEQAKAFDEFRNGDSKLIKWLRPVVNGLHAISTSAALSAGVDLAFPPANLIFSGIGILLSTSKYVRQSYDALVDVFECIENFLRRLKIYTEVPPTPAMTETAIKIMAELLGVLALATKQINQGRLKKYTRKLLGENDIESVLQRLDRLSLEESKMTAAQTLDVVHGLVNNMEEIMEDGKASTDDIRQALVLMQGVTRAVNKIERDRLQENFQRWLSAPDPWINHNIAREAHHRDTATWFTQGSISAKWQSTGSVLWVHGLPGSGKSILCSTIIEDVQDICQTGLAAFAIFYFDFREAAKQDARGLLSSLVIQLSYQSDKFSQILSSLCSAHSNGFRQPSMNALKECLKNMLELPGQGKLYIIVDALDECPNVSGYPTPREQVLKIVNELVDLHLPHVHFCITSRPEHDIRYILEPLTIHNISLHEQSGQIQDIINYINSVIPSDPNMRRWREEDRRLVIETLSRRAGGMFRWVHCQVDILRRCFPPSIRRVLDELPETLDGTYERALLGIDKQKQDSAHRLFQCLVISIRSLRVEELAEVFAIQPDANTTLGLNADWRPENPEEFVLSTCSTLVTVVNVDGEKVVQFSHFSVREYLTSSRIANSERVSYFHIRQKPAHSLLARACLSALLQLDDRINEETVQNFPLARYAAQHWVEHARFENVLSGIQEEMDCLFDKNKPHFAAWIWLYDIEHPWGRYSLMPHPTEPDTVPLYYAVLCGFRDLAERLLGVHAQDVNARGGDHETPLHAAFEQGHPDIALLLIERGADVGSRGNLRQTPLYMASSRGYPEVVQSLIDRRADLNAECDDIDEDGYHMKGTPLLVASKHRRLDIARTLLERGAKVNYQDDRGWSALHLALHRQYDDLAQLLLDHGANPNVSDVNCSTTLHEASSQGRTTFVKLLFEYGANVNARDKRGETALHKAARWGYLEVVQLLLDHGADPNAKGDNLWTSLHEAAWSGNLQVVDLLLKSGADPHALNEEGETPFQLASRENYPEVAQLLSECTGERI